MINIWRHIPCVQENGKHVSHEIKTRTGIFKTTSVDKKVIKIYNTVTETCFNCRIGKYIIKY
jgi:hypothetical protein